MDFYKSNNIFVTTVFGMVFIDIVVNLDSLEASKKDHVIDKSHLEPVMYETNVFNEDFNPSYMEFDSHSHTNTENHNYNSKDDIKTLLEEKYKFKNDETSTRFKISHDDHDYEYPVFKEGPDDRHIAWTFRSYAVRRIVGGMETSISMYPYNVAISRNGKHWCGGSIIDEQWVLTAGHCLDSAFDGDKRKLQPFVVRAGSSFHNRGGYQARINRVFFPENYVPGSADFDYSLLRLDRPMPIGRNIAVLNLPSRDYVMKEGDILIVTGWGSTDHDSGGPAVRDGVLLGIVSFGGKQCGDPRSPGVYSRVSQVTDWVEETITSNEAYKEPELIPKIKKARQREKELQKFKARVEDKKNKIKIWLRETLKSPSFIELAKKKLREVGFDTRRTLSKADINPSILDDKAMDQINLTNLLYEIIIEDGDNEADKILRTLALKEIILNDGAELLHNTTSTELTESIEAFVAYISNI
ncbi:transmembrane protease serine 3-like isoform X2 [Galleria mellonella]|uniref:trypsin n=1 Tax=Galleria mellonella TaxID=7137 RepID=A0A6J3C848_GALME|nr:transmembrane protease serine 3-like isoform X2 [Galleria mellonella]